MFVIGFVSELLGKKLEIPQAQNTTSRLAQREEKLMSDMKSSLEAIGGYEEHRGSVFDRYILPRCRLLAEVIGSRMAYEAAQNSGLSPAILSLYEHICLGEDLDQLPVIDLQSRTSTQSSYPTPYDFVLAQIRSESARRSEIDGYVTAPIASEESWKSFVNSLQVFTRPLDVMATVSKL